MNTQEKCEAIIRAIVATCDAKRDEVESATHLARPVFGLDPDVWGENSLTVWMGHAHTHVGSVPDGTFEELVDGLHSLLCDKRGLSWHSITQIEEDDL